MSSRGTVAGDGKIMPGSTYSLYDSNGNRVLVQEQNLLDTKNITTRQMVYAADGTLLKKNDGTACSLSTMVNNKVQYATITAGGTAHHFSSNGNYLGEIAQDKAGRISSSLKDQHFTGATQNDSSNVIQYQVQSGDSLKSLALNFYGNADYWYLIANLNGLTSSPDEALSAGLSIDIPARASSSNNANSFKPMDLQKIIGDTTPSLPYVPPVPAAGCNAVAMIVMIAITVVATIATAGALGPGLSAVSGFIGGVAGSVAGQVAGMAMGIVDKFPLKDAMVSGLTQGFAQGAGSALKASGWAKNLELVDKANEFTKYGKMAMAAASVGVNVAANKLAGNKASFSWRNVATGALTASALDHLQLNNITDPLERITNSGGFVSDLIHGVAGAAVGYGVSKGLYNEGSWNFRNVATDAFGNALGNSIVSKAQNIAKIQKDAAAAQQGLYSAFQGQETDNFAASLQDKATKISGQLSSDAAKQHDAATEQRLLDADALQQSYLDKGVGAIDDYLDMSRKTQDDIAGIDLLALAGRRRRQGQNAATSAYYGRKALDYRMDSPVYKGSQSLLSADQNERAKSLMNDDRWLAGVNGKQQELELLTQKLYATVYDQPDLMKESQDVKSFNKLMSEVGLVKGGLAMGYDSGVDFVYGNLHSMTPIGAPANALPSEPNFRTLTWGFGLASDAKGQPAWSTKPWRQSVDVALDTSIARMGNGLLTYGGPALGTVGLIDMVVTDATNISYNPTGWDYFSEGSKNIVDWSMAYVG